MNLKAAIISGLNLLMLVGVANASYIDFSSSAFSGANGKTFNTTIDEIGIQLTASEPSYAHLSWTSNGIGINSEIDNGWWIFDPVEDWQPNQVGGNKKSQEILDVKFLNGPVNLSQITLGQLLYQSPLFGGLEVAIYSVDGGTENKIIANDVSGFAYLFQSGVKSEPVSFNNVSRITFKAQACDVISNFTLKGLEVETVVIPEPDPVSVPEPALISFLGAGILAISGMKFFRIKK